MSDDRHDTGNAEFLYDLHGDRVHYIAVWGEWIVWAGDRWERDTRAVRMAERAKDVGRRLIEEAAATGDDDARKKALHWGNQSLGASRIRSMIELARGIGDLPLDHEALDADPYLLGVDNGVVDLRTARFRSGEPEDLMTMACPVPYSSSAEAPRWEQALKEWFPDPETRAYFQRLVGEALVGSQRHHLLTIHYGDGANGKGTATRAITRVMGPYAAVIHKSLLIETKREQHDTERAKLFRCRLAIAAETSRRVSLAEASVKNLTGGDRLSARRLYENPWEFDPSHSIWLQTNHLPEITGRDPGIWRRIRVVPWVAHFGADADPDLDDTLAAEAPGILRWAVDGARLYLAEGLDESDEVKRATLAYRSSEDVFGRFAHDIGLAIGPGLSIPGAQLIDLFTEWTKEAGATASTAELSVWLHDEGASKSRRRIEGKPNPVTVWEGVGITESDGRVHPVQGVAETFSRAYAWEKSYEPPAHPAHPAHTTLDDSSQTPPPPEPEEVMWG